MLAERYQVSPKTREYGELLEHFIFTELQAYLSYQNDLRVLTFWRSHSEFEVDFVLGDDVAIEVKATSLVQEKHLKGIRALGEEIPLKQKIIVSKDAKPRKIEDVYILPVEVFLQKLWARQLF